MVKSPQKRGKGGLLNTSSGGKGSKQNEKQLQQPINEYSDDDISDDDEHGGLDEDHDIMKLVSYRQHKQI